MQYPIESIPLTPAEREKIERISRAHLVFQAVITEETKECAEQYQAILKVHEAYHWATIQLDAALASGNRSWTAALEQDGEFADFPPAVVALRR